MVTSRPAFPSFRVRHNIIPVKARSIQKTSIPKLEWAKQAMRAIMRLQGSAELEMDIYNYNVSPACAKDWLKKVHKESEVAKTHVLRFRYEGYRNKGTLLARLEKNGKGNRKGAEITQRV